MNYALQKLLTVLLFPYTIGMTALGIGLWLRMRGGRRTGEGTPAAEPVPAGRVRWWQRMRCPAVLRRDTTWLWFGWLWLLVWSIPAIPNGMTRALEAPYPVVRVEDQPKADAIVVLGGAVGRAEPPARPYPSLHDAADRYWHAMRLFRAGRAPVIVVSAGRGEAPFGVVFLRDLGVPETAILSEEESRTTAGNAFYTRRLLEGSGRRRILLCTSAQHMRRAVAAFEREGFEVIPAATDHQAPLDGDPADWGWTPDAGALGAAGSLLREYAGRLAYALGLGAR